MEAAIVRVTSGVVDNTDEPDDKGELLETSVILTVIVLENVDIGEKDSKLVIVAITEYEGVSVGNDAFAEIVEVAVMVPVNDCIAEFEKEVDAVFDCRTDDENESILVAVTLVENVFKIVTVAITLPVCTNVTSAV